MTHDAPFRDRVVIVTGAGNGLGQAHAELLARMGARVVVNNRHRPETGTSSSAEATVDRIAAAGGIAIANHADIATEVGAQSLVDSALQSWGRVDALICNAGFTRDKTFLKMSLADFRAVMEVHLMGTVFCARVVLPVMRARNYGRIVCTISAAGLHGNFGQTNYAAAKGAIIGFMRSLDQEVRRYGIRVNALAPFAVTNMTKNGSMAKQFEERFRTDRVAPAAAYLASDRCDFGGEIMIAAGGYFGNAAMVEGPGLRLGGDALATLDYLCENISDIRRLVPHRRFDNAVESADYVLFDRDASNQGNAR